MSRNFLEGMMPQDNSILSLVEEDILHKKYSKAMYRLVSISNELSHDMGYLSLLSFVQKMLGDLAGQIKTLSILATKTNRVHIKLDLMSALYAEGRLNEALDVGLELQSLELRLDSVEGISLSHLLVKIYLEFSDYEGVEEILKLSFSQLPTDDVLNWASGVLSLTREQKNEALNFFRKAIALNESSEQAWISLALLHEEMGDRELAIANIERALDINPLQSTALKLMMKWQHNSRIDTARVIEKVDFYLQNTDFDVDIEICYAQMLSQNNAIDRAQFELDKSVLFQPSNTQLQSLRIHLQEL